MAISWPAFLEAQGAHFVGDGVAHFGEPRTQGTRVQTASLCPLTSWGLIAAQGSDAVTFLQGQLTCDVAAVTVDRHGLGAHCNPKGRIRALFRLFQSRDGLYLRCPRELVDAALLGLKRYILRAAVTLEAATHQGSLGVAGPGAAAVLAEALPGVVPPPTPGAAALAEDIAILRVPGDGERFELHGPTAALAKLWPALARGAVPTGYPIWHLGDIQAGLPQIYPATAEAFIPQMINLEHLGGVSFKKGCYTGQEIVARSHYLGSVKRRLYGAKVTTGAPPAPGLPVLAEPGEAAAERGKVVDAAPLGDGGAELLVVLNLAAAEGPGAGALVLEDGRPLVALAPRAPLPKAAP
ncbi:MAG: YgfZ/GcvT domain-containing protein [Candidatus Competibacterales bacterium]